MPTSDDSNSHNIDLLIEQAHLALLRRDLDTAVNNLREVLRLDSANQDALSMTSDIHSAISEHERDVRISADDLRIKKEQDEAWKRDQKYKDQQLIDSIMHPSFGSRGLSDPAWRIIIDYLTNR